MCLYKQYTVLGIYFKEIQFEMIQLNSCQNAILQHKDTVKP